MINKNTISRLDTGDAYQSMELTLKQGMQAYKEMKQVGLSDDYKDCTSVVFAGMGGSNLGFRLIQSVFQETFSLPAELVNHYQLPAYANEKTLVVVSSYSGNTEEAVMVAQQAVKKNCKVIAITTGGQIAELAEVHGFPIYIIDPKHNPSKQPRLGLGYSVFAQIALFEELRMIQLEQTVEDISQELIEISKQWLVDEAHNQALDFAEKLQDKIPLFIGAEQFVGNIRIANNQFNENAKNFATHFALPELNHHLMEGLSYPTEMKTMLTGVLFSSDLCLPRNQKRLSLTKEIMNKNGIETLIYKAQASTKLSQALEVLLFSTYVSFYLAMMQNVNPSDIPWVDYFKSNL